MTKYERIATLAEETAKQITKNSMEWTSYLHTASRLYRYPFDEQILIYAQRPDATACALIEQWNKKLNCWVNRGAKGIALIDRTSIRPRLKYVFDISDVHKARRIGRFPKLWKLKEEHKEYVIACLEKSYGETNPKLSFEHRLVELAERIVLDSYEELLKDLSYVSKKSFLEDLDEQNIGVRLRETLVASIAYTLLVRCGANMEQWKEELNFDYISDFNTSKTLSILGSATTEISKCLLMEIGRSIVAYERNVIQHKTRVIPTPEKKLEKGLANVSEIDYNALNRESEKKKEDLAHEADIRNERGLSYSESITKRGSEGNSDEIRIDEKTLFGEEQKRDIQWNVADRGIRNPLPSDTATGRGENGASDDANGESRGSDRATKSNRPNEMGGTDEQHSTLSRGDSVTRTDLQLETKIYSEWIEPDSEVTSLFGFSLPKLHEIAKGEKLQKAILCDDTHLKHKRPEIAGYFQIESNPRFQADYLQHSYRMEEVTELFLEDVRVGYRADEDGITLWKGGFVNREAESRLTWEEVRFLVHSYMEDGIYLAEGEVAEEIDTNGLYQQLDLFTSFSEQIGNIAIKQTEEAVSHISQEQIVEMTSAKWKTEQELVAQTEQETSGQDVQTLEELEQTIEPITAKGKELSIDKSKAVNFKITDHALGVGSAKEKFRKNIEAIRTLEQVESEQRIATPEEQQILSQYVGWGGLADAFDESKSAWAREYEELKQLLSPKEYESARSSTLTAYYTSPIIIRSIYEVLENMGFEKGNILEPSMGIGNFFGMLPEKMTESRLYGVELDSITGRIAKQLYPKATIQITGFEKSDYPNDFFDIVIGNVPFGQYKVADKQFDKHNFFIHDYFFAKALDKVRPKGVIAFITSKGTMDKKSPEVRKYLAQRAELLGAVRLPNTAFQANAGTEVTSDILFFQKRDRWGDIEPEWVHLAEDENGIVQNSYFVIHPEMIVGKMTMISGQYGMESICVADTTRPLVEQLREAVQHIQGQIETVELDELEDELDNVTILADPEVKNFSYTLVEENIYYRENSIMKPVSMPEGMQERVKGMIGIRNCTQELIRLQLEEYSEVQIQEKQAQLNHLYDAFQKKYGLLNSQRNKRAFHQDSSYALLCSLEQLDEEGNFKGKADMFTKRTIKKAEVVTSVDTASEALAVCLSEKAKIDFDYMIHLMIDKTEDREIYDNTLNKIIEELQGVIFQNPVTEQWEMADEYLSGNVREKLEVAKLFAEKNPKYTLNVQALTQVQPKELDASDIEVRIGATWIDKKYIEDFMCDLFQTPEHLLSRNVIGIQFSDITGEWNVKGKNADYGNTLVYMTYGSSRRNAYQILEDSLNLKDSRVYDIIEEDGKEKRILNKKETMIVSQKQEAIREAFQNWIFEKQERREDLVAKYNRLFNSTRPREYDGSHLKFPGMTPDIILRPHQLNAVAHQLYGNNTLLAHCVGAGKTFCMIAAAMESKRLGLCQKSLFVVPNHLTEQWASDFLQLYPGANILAATKKDFEPTNRKKFCSRIATGDYDAVIIGHSQYEKIPLSAERQIAIVERQIEEIQTAIALAKVDNGEKYTIKQMEKTKKALQTKLEKLYDGSKKDSVVTFEQLGVDRLFVDESHSYKNLFLYTKMRNVSGIAQTEAQKSSDMFAKCQYMDEITGGKGITFATGTPISNSMTELYTNMRYLQFATLQKMGLGQFDSWASAFGETQTAIELAPEGTGYRAKTRFSKFFNLPELIALFKECADIQTPDMLKLPIPEAEYENIVLKPSKYQQDIVASLAERAEAVRDRRVQPNVDNMLRITNDGRKLALDQRLMNDMLPDEKNSKANVCAEKAFEIWEQTKEQKSTQLIFCDLSTPKGDDTFNVYDDIRNKLIAKGVPEEEIAFIHQANTEVKKTELFAKVRSGQVRFLLGSTAKMGAGTNVQHRLIALHHTDVPWVRLEVA